MASGWFFNIPLTGHINPTLPLVRALVQGGDELTYFSSPAYQDRIGAAGAIFRSYTNLEALEGTRNVTHLIHQGGQIARATHGLLAEVLKAVDQERPDYLLFDIERAVGWHRQPPARHPGGRQLPAPAVLLEDGCHGLAHPVERAAQYPAGLWLLA